MPVNRIVVGSIPTRRDEKFIYIYIFISSLWCRGESAVLRSATQHAMPPEIGGNWGTECLNTRFPLPTVCGIQREAEKKIAQRINLKINKISKTCALSGDGARGCAPTAVPAAVRPRARRRGDARAVPARPRRRRAAAAPARAGHAHGSVRCARVVL